MMKSTEDVAKAINCCANAGDDYESCIDCPYFDFDNCFDTLLSDIRGIAETEYKRGFSEGYMRGVNSNGN